MYQRVPRCRSAEAARPSIVSALTRPPQNRRHKPRPGAKLRSRAGSNLALTRLGPELAGAKNIWAVESSELTAPGLALGVARGHMAGGQVEASFFDQIDDLGAGTAQR